MKFSARLLCAALLLSASAAWAAVSRDDAAAAAQRMVEGRVLAVERYDAGGRPMWRVKLVTPRGDVRVILVDATSGQAN
jgi:uncharacterized membrane protein YkoI